MASTTSKSKKGRVAPPRGRPTSSSALSQPVVEDASSLNTISSFSPKGDLFAYLSLAVEKHRIRVYDTVTGQSVAEHVVDSARVTALSWAQIDLTEGPLALAEEDASPKKKRKKQSNVVAQVSANEPLSEAAQVVILGLSNGTLLLFSPSHGRALRTLSHPSSITAILSISVYIDSQNAFTIWTSGADSSVRLWNAQKGSHVASWKNDDRIPCSSISIRPGARSDPDDRVEFLLANHGIRLFSTSHNASSISDISKPKELTSFTGHASNVTSLHWVESKSGSHLHSLFVSMAEADRHVYLWEVPAEATSGGKLVASIPLDSNARQLSFSSTSQGQNLLVLSASGKVSLFSVVSEQTDATPSKTSKHKVPTLTPRSMVTTSVKQSGAPVDVVAASFVPNEEGQVRIARLAGGVRPVFEVVQYLDDSGEFIQDVTVVQKDTNAGLTKDSDQVIGVPNKRYAESSNIAVRSGNEFGQDVSADDLALRDVDGALDVDLAELSLGQRLTALDPGAAPARPSDSDSPDEGEEDDGTVPSSRARRRPAASATSSITLTRTLIQALHSSDMRLLETCLAHTDSGLIMNTVRRLPPQLAVPLLTACMERLGRGKRAGAGKGGGAGAGSQRGMGLVRWIKTVLVVHSGHLMTVMLSFTLFLAHAHSFFSQMPDLVARLSGLHATLTTRLTLQESLLSLSGRLDMVLQQIELRSSVAPAPLAPPSQTKGDKPNGSAHGLNGRVPRRYIEGESEDEEAEADRMDVEVEEESEVGSVEDVELGGESDSEEDDSEEDDEEDDEDEDDDDEAPRLNGFIDDEAEDESEDESE
ncbi:hypothetical protein EW146_g3548 [Bondarzewia mesenterica]|uniref:Small-subunit processome Utp12 domain-containing protein n=1 Tax=Bondarzewia mesenterica TaxID=1095465 RepID=A0A4S4LYQ1_9AGAM|nr:hypothetical protein EW146_g3548 [Bondarzewia mesenterica]